MLKQGEASAIERDGVLLLDTVADSYRMSMIIGLQIGNHMMTRPPCEKKGCYCFEREYFAIFTKDRIVDVRVEVV